MELVNPFFTIEIIATSLLLCDYCMHAWYPGYLYLAGREDERTDGLNYEYLQCKSFTEGALPSPQGLAT